MYKVSTLLRVHTGMNISTNCIMLHFLCAFCTLKETAQYTGVTEAFMMQTDGDSQRYHIVGLCFVLIMFKNNLYIMYTSKT